MRKTAQTALGIVTALALTAAPLASASARDWDHERGGWDRGHGGWGRGEFHDRGFHHGEGPIIGFGAAVVGAAFALATVPFAIAADIASPGPVYATASYPQPYPQPVYAAPPPYGYYYRRPHPVVVYGYPPAYAYPQPVYAAPPGYAVAPY